MLKRLHFIALLLLCFVLLFKAEALQAQSNLRTKKLIAINDTLIIDTLSLVPGTIEIKRNGELLDSSLYQCDALYAVLLLNIPEGDSIEISYRVFPEQFTRLRSHKSNQQKDPDLQKNISSFTFQPGKKNIDFFETDGLTKSGSISRGVNFGNNQDLSVNSNLNLQLSGKISDKVSLLASVTDDNIPIQPDGNTQQLQDFDQVFIKVYDEKSSLTAGDFWMKKPAGYFLVYNKRAQGAGFATLRGDPKGKGQWENRSGAALSKGKFARNQIQGIEGNQGPYRLRGAENETFIIVLAGTEQVYIDGQLLKRGQENDYIIDYNTAEITFTPNKLITKDRRIIVEFQYSDKNYARSVFESSTSFRKEKWMAYLNVYSEQDSKNQPLQQELSDSAKLLFSSIGDSLHLAVFPSEDSVGYNDNRVLYKKTDSLGYDPVYVFSIHPDSALYALRFSYVGEGRGDYVQSEFTALGRTFRWVAPDTIAGIIYKRGNYAPVELLVAPKKRQMLSAGFERLIGKTGKIRAEGAWSGHDENSFSGLHNSDDQGYAIKAGAENHFALSKTKKELRLFVRADVEATSSGFKYIERYRAVEFERNWNVLNQKISGEQFIGDAELALENGKKGRLAYGFNSFIAAKDYTGMLHRINGFYDNRGWKSTLNGSYLGSQGNNSSAFLRHKFSIARSIGKIIIGYRDEYENNRFFNQNRDSLQRGSYSFYDWEVFIQSTDSSRNRLGISYRERKDRAWDSISIAPSTHARQASMTIDLLKNPNSQLRTNTGYRELMIIDSSLSLQQPDRTLLNRIEYDLRLKRNAVNWSFFYEIGTGQELKKEFIYLEVPAGQGLYTWIDYNENGLKELSEFELSAFPDQATYIRSFTPTNEYLRTYTNQFSQTLNLNPSNLWRNKKGLLHYLSFVSNQTTYRIDRKTNSENELERFNPFARAIADSALLALNSSFRNTLFINRTGAVFGADYSFQDNRGKSLLTNGFDSRSHQFHQAKIRWNITKAYSIVFEAETGEKSSSSDFLSGRNYLIFYYRAQPKISFQPNTRFRWSILYKYSDKKNKEEFGNESAFLNDAGTEIRYNVVNKGSLLINFNYVEIRYSGNANSSLAFEMLEALKPGTNFIWSASWQQNLSKHMQLQLNYIGRKSEENKAIHSGGIQVRAFF